MLLYIFGGGRGAGVVGRLKWQSVNEREGWKVKGWLLSGLAWQDLGIGKHADTWVARVALNASGGLSGCTV